MSAPDFAAQLKEEEARRQARGMPPQVRAGLRQRLVTGKRASAPSWRLRVAAVALGIALVLLGVRLWLRPERVGSFELASASADFRAEIGADGAIEVRGGRATLLDSSSGIALVPEGAARVRRAPGGVRVERGVLQVQVQHRPAGQAPAVVFVSEGAIEVMGTRFTVTQQAAGGSVTLHEGAIRFRPLTGEVQLLRPGERVEWHRPSPPPPLPAPTTGEPSPPPSAPTAPGQPPAPHRSADSGALLEEVDLLRSRGGYEEAARLLREGLASQPQSSRERLSFELGTLLMHQLRDPARACAQWRWHRAHFGSGRYAAEVRREREAAGCR